MTSETMAEKTQRLAPVSEAEKFLADMDPEERLPKYDENSLEIGPDISPELKAIIRTIGTPKPLE